LYSASALLRVRSIATRSLSQVAEGGSIPARRQLFLIVAWVTESQAVAENSIASRIVSELGVGNSGVIIS